jgi:hypothetical protein
MARLGKRGAKGRCGATGKRRYRDKRESLLVLHTAQTARHWAELDGIETRRGEVRIYPCPRCHGWHATSQAA